MVPLPCYWKSNLAAVAGLLLASSAYGETPGSLAASPERIFSANRKLVVEGPHSGENAVLAIWGEDMLEAFQSAVGFTVPDLLRSPIVIRIFDHYDEPTSKLRKIQHKQGDYVTQHLELMKGQSLDQEDLLEALISLFIQRLVWSRSQLEDEALQKTRVPDWFGSGMAQCLLPELRKRNRRLVYSYWQDDELPSLDELLQSVFFPPGRWKQKYAAASMVGWLMEQNDFPKLAGMLMRTWSVGEEVNADVLQAFMKRPRGISTLTQEWDLWIAHYEQVTTSGALQQRQGLTRLDTLIRSTFPVTTAEGTHDITMDRLSDHTGTEWFLEVLDKLQGAVSYSGVRRSEEFQIVLDKFDLYFSALRTMHKGRLHWYVAAPSARKVRSLYLHAVASLDDYRVLIQRREHYLESFKEGAGETSSPAVSPAQRAYLDQFESTPLKARE